MFCYGGENASAFTLAFIRTKVDQIEEQEEMSNTYILVVCPYNVCDVRPCQLIIWLWIKLVEKGRKKPSLPCERELPKHKNCERTNGVITHYVLKC